MEFVIGGLALLLGLAAGILWRGRRAAEQAARAQAELDAARAALGSTQRDLDKVHAAFEAWKASTESLRKSDAERLEELKNQFVALGQQVFKTNSEQFMAHAGDTLEQRRKAIEDLLKPLNETLGRLQTGAQELEGKREKAYGALESQIRQLGLATDTLAQSSRSLTTALRGDARSRGRWGEVALRNVAEMAGMSVHCDFEVQVTLPDGSRPDMVVKLPGNEGRIPVDAKVPMDAYMRALDAEDPDVRAAEFAKHAEDLRGHVRTLARRDYASALQAEVDFTVMFVPADAVLAAAHESAPDLQAEAMEKRVLLVTPVTLVALLRTVALYWSQAAIAENAQAMWEEAREFHKRVQKFSEHLLAIGKGLDGALRSYDAAIGSYEGRVLPQGRRLEELEAPGGTERALPDIAPIARQPRVLAADGTEAP